MIQKAQIHAFTSNFPNLQGLKALPTGLFLLMVVIWDNQQSGDSRDLTLIFILAVTMLIFYWFVDQYYRLAFGSVELNQRDRMRSYAWSAFWGVLGLASYILDSAQRLPFSTMGLFWSMLLVVDGLRIHRSLPGRTFPFFWIFAVLIGAVSLLSLFGLSNWWNVLGFYKLSGAIMALLSLIIIASGVLWHRFLARNLAIMEG